MVEMKHSIFLLLKTVLAKRLCEGIYVQVSHSNVYNLVQSTLHLSFSPSGAKPSVTHSFETKIACGLC